ncbi:MAG: hypothetical protein KF910_09435 [Brevundimonas sp.]|uniref:hypothetical protein n=1 Tax=Brevundimonas sp. TaxID=1871086 RepID=UPI0025C61F1C|nr:hypothetical protein [Brevundimonas sp.]MBX3477820.1 hypothetical protein [Brevundimonas sp.]
MTANAKIAPIAVSAVTSGAGSSGFDTRRDATAQEAENAARYRLVIEEGPQKGSFIYKTLDRLTGEIVRQLPREDLVRMMETQRYAAGAVIDTSV